MDTQARHKHALPKTQPFALRNMRSYVASETCILPCGKDVLVAWLLLESISEGEMRGFAADRPERKG